MRAVTIRPIDQPTTTDRWVLARAANARRCIEGCPDPVFADGRYVLAALGQGAVCSVCAPLRVPTPTLELLDLANAASNVLDAAPVGWQRDAGDLAISTLTAVLRDHGLI